MRPLPSALKAFLSVAGLVVVPLASSGASGDLDITFQNKGWKTSPANNDFQGMALQPDGKVVVTGGVYGEGPHKLGVWRFLPDGSPDTSFNGTGRFVFGDITGTHGRQVTVLADGKILVVGGFFSESNGASNHLLVRLLPDGQLDSGFGSSLRGWIGNEVNAYGQFMALQSDGSIFVAGGGGLVARYSANGMPAGTFGSLTDPAIGSLAVQSDGKILVGRYDGTVRRLLPGGGPDSFGTMPGTASLQSGLPGGWMGVTGITVLAGGKILASGSYEDALGESGMFVARLLPNGALDPAFGTGSHGPGLALNSFGDESESCYALSVQESGHILLAGSVTAGDFLPPDVALMRFTPDGLPDSLFGTDGRVRTDFGSDSGMGLAAVLVSERKLLVAGVHSSVSAASPDYYGDGLLMRYRTETEAVSLVVEHPAGVEMKPGSGAALDFGIVTSGTGVREVILRNDGIVPLTGLTASLTNESHPGDFQMGTLPSTLAPRATVTLGIRLTPSASPGARTATLHVASDTPGLTPFDLSLTGSKATPQQIWRVTWFGSPDNSGAGADLNDFDGDGLVNFMEYATSSNPHQATASVCAVVKEGAGAGFIYPRPAAALSEFKYEPEAAASLAGPWSGEGLVSSVESENAGAQTVKVIAEGGTAGGRRFFRLRVTRL